MYLAIINLPLLGSILSGFFGRKIGISGAQLITSTCLITTTILAIIAFIEVGLNNISVFVNLLRWIDSESFNIIYDFQFDNLTVAMLIPVLIVSFLVHIYSVGYMSHDPHSQRFFSYLSLFTFMMIILVTANNYLLMFVGWEGVGVCSYLLINFWFTRVAANESSISAFLTNRVGDCFLTLGIFAILWSFGNINYSTVFTLAGFVNVNIITMLGICLLIGAMAKSSQIGLHVWLPMAMEGPTPVSALIHAATMVTAGVYLLIRSSSLIEYSSTVLLFCLWLGAITTVFSSLIGLFQLDIKKVIAYSTMSQLGMMVIAIGLSSYNVALFHLLNHAFYKALLFLGAGSVIHAVGDNQDFRKYGGLISYLPLTYSVMLIASLSLIAFPFMSGFYSKDIILESLYGGFFFSGIIIYYLGVIGATLTGLYSVKVLYLTFLTNPKGSIINYKDNINNLEYNLKPYNFNNWQGWFNFKLEWQIYKIFYYFKYKFIKEDFFMNLPLIILAVFSIFFGYITKDLFIGLGSPFAKGNSFFVVFLPEIFLDTEFSVNIWFKLLPVVLTITIYLCNLILGYYSYTMLYLKFSTVGYNIFTFFNQGLLIPLVYNTYINKLIYKLGNQTTIVLDKGTVELLGPFGLEKALLNLSHNISNLSIGTITNYSLYILISFIFNLLVAIFTNIDLIMLCILGLLILPLLGGINNLIKDTNTSNQNSESTNTSNQNSESTDTSNQNLESTSKPGFVVNNIVKPISSRKYSTNNFTNKSVIIVKKKRYFTRENLLKYITIKHILTGLLYISFFFCIKFLFFPFILNYFPVNICEDIQSVLSLVCNPMNYFILNEIIDTNLDIDNHTYNDTSKNAYNKYNCYKSDNEDENTTSNYNSGRPNNASTNTDDSPFARNPNYIIELTPREQKKIREDIFHRAVKEVEKYKYIVVDRLDENKNLIREYKRVERDEEINDRNRPNREMAHKLFNQDLKRALPFNGDYNVDKNGKVIQWIDTAKSKRVERVERRTEANMANTNNLKRKHSNIYELLNSTSNVPQQDNPTDDGSAAKRVKHTSNVPQQGNPADAPRGVKRTSSVLEEDNLVDAPRGVKRTSNVLEEDSSADERPRRKRVKHTSNVPKERPGTSNIYALLNATYVPKILNPTPPQKPVDTSNIPFHNPNKSNEVPKEPNLYVFNMNYRGRTGDTGHYAASLNPNNPHVDNAHNDPTWLPGKGPRGR